MNNKNAIMQDYKHLAKKPKSKLKTFLQCAYVFAGISATMLLPGARDAINSHIQKPTPVASETRTCIIKSNGVTTEWPDCKIINDQYAKVN